MRYLEVADRLRALLVERAPRPGGALPSESELAAEFGVSRVTVRRALETLRGQGLVRSRQGAGWFVAQDPVRQPLGRITTVEAAVEAAGAAPGRTILEFSYEPAPAPAAEALHLEAGAEVLRVRRLNLADGEPFALVTVWVPARLAHDLSWDDVERAPFYDLLPLRGVVLERAVQTVSADVATAADATLLHVERGTPLLVCRRVTYGAAGEPCLYSEHRYPAQRTTLEIEFPSAAFTQTGAPNG